MALGQALADLDNKLTAAVVAAPRAAASTTTAQLFSQMGTALPVLRECCRLAGVVGLAGGDAARFAGCARLLVGGAVEAMLAGWDEVFAPALRQAAAATAAAPAAPAAHGRLYKEGMFQASAVHLQLQAMHSLLQWLAASQHEGPGLAAAAAALRPEDVQRWLAGVLAVFALGGEAGAWARLVPAGRHPLLALLAAPFGGCPHQSGHDPCCRDPCVTVLAPQAATMPTCQSWRRRAPPC